MNKHDKQRLLELAGIVKAPYRSGSSKSGFLAEGYKIQPNALTQYHFEIADDRSDDSGEISLNISWYITPGRPATRMDPAEDPEAEVYKIELAAPFQFHGKKYTQWNKEVESLILHFAITEQFKKGQDVQEWLEANQSAEAFKAFGYRRHDDGDWKYDEWRQEGPGRFR